MAQQSKHHTRIHPPLSPEFLGVGAGGSGTAGTRHAASVHFATNFEKLAGERSLLELPAGQLIYSQEDPADSVFYIVRGRVKLAVVSATGKEAVVAILDNGHFFGQGSLLGRQPVRLATAISLSPTLLARFDREEMSHRMHRDSEFADAFVSYLVAHVGRIEANLVDQLLNSTEKRLARVLLLLADFGKDEVERPGTVPRLSQETLAHMVGASRARVSSFLNKFRKAGFIEYNADERDPGDHGGIRVNSSILKVILGD